ncbi:unannotated protein [freshwater metagenome]|uniref:Unannotated protein n=1 Tax=freshwater metagenome TaxID=449393 RepID=A0A6J7B8U9_9ZZZZ|nr:mycothiol synthase [Actinomycetota bacterium]
MELRHHAHLSESQSAEIFQLANLSAIEDGINPLSEHVALHLREGGDDHDQHLIVVSDSHILGYAHLDLSDQVEGPSAEIVVAPAARMRGVGKMLVNELSLIAGEKLRLWSHGDLAGAASLANTLVFNRVRTLHQLRRSLEIPLPAHSLPSSVSLRALKDEDIQEWLQVNSRSFANHPEQRIWSARDVHLRMKEPWFDRNGFLVAFEDEKMVAFCWTKVHGLTSGHGHVPIGEIYVIGVDPSAQGRGLGRELTVAGLSYLRNNGIRTAMLYVESDNSPANQMYQALGFTEWAIDVMYRK